MLTIEKSNPRADGPDGAKPATTSVLKCLEAMVIDDGPGSEHATILVHGPGTFESRQEKNDLLLQKSKYVWKSQFRLETRRGRDGGPQTSVLIQGEPKVIGPSGAVLNARDSLDFLFDPPSR